MGESNIKISNEPNVSYLYINLACLFVCPFVSNKRQNRWTDRAQILCGISRDPREGLWMIKFSKISKINEIFFIKSANFFVFVLLTRRTPMFTNEIKDGRETP